MTPLRHPLVCLLPVLFLFVVPACGSDSDDSGDDSSGGSESGGVSSSVGGVDDESGGTGTETSGGSAGETSGGSAGEMDTGEPNCDFPNGQVIATGTFEPTVSDSSANLDVDPPGTLDCQAEFYAAGGGTLETGGDPTGSTTIVCHAFGSELFNGFVIDFLYRPMENTSYPLGFPSLIPAGITATYNGEALLTYDEGPICDTLQDKAKQWTAEGGGGTLEVGTVDGDNFEFSIVDASFSPVDGGTNYLGTGTFTLAGEGSADLVEK